MWLAHGHPDRLWSHIFYLPRVAPWWNCYLSGHLPSAALSCIEQSSAGGLSRKLTIMAWNGDKIVAVVDLDTLSFISLDMAVFSWYNMIITYQGMSLPNSRLVNLVVMVQFQWNVAPKICWQLETLIDTLDLAWHNMWFSTVFPGYFINMSLTQVSLFAVILWILTFQSVVNMQHKHWLCSLTDQCT